MKDKALLLEIRERYDDGWNGDNQNRVEMDSDLQLVAGHQWPEDVRLEREEDGRPCITENHMPQFVRQVANDMRANPPAVKVIAGNGGAEKAVADILTGMIRDIEAKSKTQRPYVTAGASAARCGIGHWRILTDYTSPTSFEQEIRIEPIHNPFAVVWDPVAVTATREDANWCFVVEEISEDEFARQYPKATPISFDDKDVETWAPGWMNADTKTVKIAEYWRKIKTPATVCQMMDGSTHFEDEMPPGAEAYVVNKRDSDRCKIEVIKTNGVEILEKAQEFPSRYIPIIPVVGEEYSVGTKMVRHSIIRFAKDSQIMHNYWLSTQTEHLALQPKAPYVATAKQIQNYADIWRTANTANHSVLLYDVDKDAPTMTPQRSQPPASSSAFAEQINRANEGMKATTGIHNASLGMDGNEKSGRAILARQREGDVGTYEFRDNLDASVEHTGRILVEMIPVIYDTPRMQRIIGEDGSEDFAEINKPVMDPMTGQQKVENNLKVGEYSVQVRSGPSYTTRRQEAAESMLQFVQTMPQSASAVMDLVAKNMDWPGADEFSERFKKLLPPQLAEDMEDETDDPEELQKRQAKQAAAQQQQQLQQRGIDAEIGQKEAQTLKAQADARKADADAIQTQMETMMQSGQLQQMIGQLVSAQIQQAMQSMQPPPMPMGQQPMQPPPMPMGQPMQQPAPMEQPQPMQPPVSGGQGPY